MSDALFAIVLLLAGLAILVAEIFIPSGGAISVLAVACIGGSLYCAVQAWWGVNPSFFWAYVLSVILLIPTAIGGSLWALPYTPWGQSVILAGPKAEDVTPMREETARLTALIGQTGRAMNLMNPGGMVEVEGERLHAESPGQFIDPGTEVEVVAVKGVRVVVRPYVPPRLDEDSAGLATAIETTTMGSRTDDADEMVTLPEETPSTSHDDPRFEETLIAETSPAPSDKTTGPTAEDDGNFDPFLLPEESGETTGPENDSPLDFDIPDEKLADGGSDSPHRS